MELTKSEQVCLLVLGMHRSGTSALTRTLNLLGATLPSNLLPPVGGNNEKGFWESRHLMELHDEFLIKLGSTWEDPGPLKKDILSAAERHAFSVKLQGFLQREFASSSLCVLKDPRVCRLLPFWNEAAVTQDRTIKTIGILRNPYEVAASLSKRDDFSFEKSILLWLRHSLEAELNSRSFKRCFIHFADLFKDWKGVASHIADFLDMKWPISYASIEKEMGSFLSLDHWHHRSEDQELSLYQPIIDFVYEALIQLMQDPMDSESLKKLDFMSRLLEASDNFLTRGNSYQDLKEKGSHLDPYPRYMLKHLLVALQKDSQEIEEQRLQTIQNQISELSGRIETLATHVDTQQESMKNLDRSQSDLHHQLTENMRNLFRTADSKINQVKSVEETAALVNGVRHLIASNKIMERKIDQLKTNAAVKPSGPNKFRPTKVTKAVLLGLMPKSWRGTVTLANSVLFNAHYYRSSHQEVEQSDLPPSKHYLKIGGKGGLKPSPLFDTAYYNHHNPDVVENGLNPLVHYLNFGFRENRTPHPLFDLAWYRANYMKEKENDIDPVTHYLVTGHKNNFHPNPLFDNNWYRSNLAEEDKRQAPLVHYIEKGIDDVLDPHPLFLAQWYLVKYPDVAQSGMNPLQHYLEFGEHEGRCPNDFFDPIWYRNTYPETQDLGIPLLAHYYMIGAKKGYDPCPEFNTQYYLETHYDVKEAGLDALTHYLRTGQYEKRVIRYSLKADPSYAMEEVKILLSQTKASQIRSQYFTEYKEHDPVSTDQKIIAFYLPQFHPIPENDEWWGKGFTEWSNVTKALPQFEGHIQPKLPSDLGYYDLRLPEIQKQQIELARNYGIYGFCYHYYWFKGKRLLERPLDNLLKDPSMDFPFCICWANENWTRVWDGQDREILMEQDHTPEDDMAFIQSLEPVLRDPRYCRIDGRPVLIVYRPSLMPEPEMTARRWRDFCREKGLGELFLMCVQFDVDDPRTFDFDAAVEFPPHKLARDLPHINRQFNLLNPDFRGAIISYEDMINRAKNQVVPPYPMVRGVTPAWDNTARRSEKGTIYQGSTPPLFSKWLQESLKYAKENPIHGESMVMINAWNEWAEGAYLEPDQYYGHAYLEAVNQALQNQGEKISRTNGKKIILVTHDCHNHGAQQNALHMARTLKDHFHFEVELILASDSGVLEPLFQEIGPVHHLYPRACNPSELKRKLETLKSNGFQQAICNTTVSGLLLGEMVDTGIQCIALIHELPSLIKEYGLLRHVQIIAHKAHKIIFAANLVREGFLSFAPKAKDRTQIKPQGLYKPVQQAILDQKSKWAQQIRKHLGLPGDAFIILGAGWADLRKGFDIFTRIALQICQANEKAAFIWLGCEDPNLKHWATHDLKLLGLEKRVLLLPRVDDVAEFYAAADLFLLTSREDPFPSVVMEAMSYGVPTVAFEDATGCVDIISRGSGIVVPYLDETKMSQAIQDLMQDSNLRQKLSSTAQELIKQEFNWIDYMHQLLDWVQYPQFKVSVIIPNFNYANHLRTRLQTVFSQTFPIYEVLVLDDASTDNSLEELDKIRDEFGYDFTLVKNQTNSGSVFKQWLKGLELAKGDLVWIAEADDFCESTFLEEVVAGFNKPDTVLSYCESKQVNGDGKVMAMNYQNYVQDIDPHKWETSYHRNGMDEIRDSLLVKNTIPNVSAVVFRREQLLKTLKSHFNMIGSLKVAGDWATYVKLLENGDISFIQKPLNSHRRHESSVTLSSFNMSQLVEIAKMQDTVIQLIKPDKSNLEKADRYLDELYEQFQLKSDSYPEWKTHPELTHVRQFN